MKKANMIPARTGRLTYAATRKKGAPAGRIGKLTYAGQRKKGEPAGRIGRLWQ